MKYLQVIIGLVIIGASLKVYLTKMQEHSFIESEKEVIIPPDPTPEYKFGYQVNNLEVITGKIKRNQNLADILKDFNVSQEELNGISKSSKNVLDVRKLVVGRNYTIISENDSLKTPVAFIYEPNKIEFVVYNFMDSLYTEKRERPVKIIEKQVGGIIKSSLAETMDELDISPQLTNDFADVFAWQIDFFRLFPGDQFKVIYEEITVDGESVEIGKIIGAYFNHNNEPFYAIYFDQDLGEDYFDPEGQSLRKALLKYPLKFSRISSRYSGRRYHPVHKTYKAHRGTDFAAPRGTPIRSVGDGIIQEAKYGNYNGNFVKIKHNGIYATQYLHLSKIASGIKPGARVKQGQTIGYVGKTGLARGNHLCFRFWKNGYQVDALRVKLSPSEPIKEVNKTSFDKITRQVVTSLDSIIIEGNLSLFAKSN